jgi:F-type H+-transporting ATPase subunit gamma
MFRKLSATSAVAGQGRRGRPRLHRPEGGAFFRRLKVNMVGSVTHWASAADGKLIGVIKVMLDAYAEGKVDRVFLAYNRFVNTMTQKATFDQLLPLPPPSQATSHDWDYIYEPDAEGVLEHVLTRYIESLVYQACSRTSPPNTPRAWSR